jgi:ribonuclease P protein component
LNNRLAFMESFRFAKAEHLRSPLDFQRVYDRKRSVSDDWLIMYGCPNDLAYSRLGLSVSRKVGGAVVRNRFRRLYREAFRLTRDSIPAGLDLILIPRSPNIPTLEKLKHVLPKLASALVKKLAKEATS